ncbi:hypothetical protein CR513_06105, partial [Mucuna pruriens]
MLITALLSQYNFIGMCMSICNSSRTLFNQSISRTSLAIALCFASTLLLDTTFCFLLCQVDLLSVIDPAQSTLVYASIFCCEVILTVLPSFSSQSFLFGSIGVSTGLQPLILVSSRRLRIYFLYETIIPFFDLATSIPRKYLKDPRIFISNVVEMELFKDQSRLAARDRRTHMEFSLTIGVFHGASNKYPLYAKIFYNGCTMTFSVQHC